MLVFSFTVRETAYFLGREEFEENSGIFVCFVLFTLFLVFDFLSSGFSFKGSFIFFPLCFGGSVGYYFFVSMRREGKERQEASSVAEKRYCTLVISRTKGRKKRKEKGM